MPITIPLTLFGKEYQVFYGSCCSSQSDKRTLYVEFTDICNAHCPFCSASHGTKVLSPDALGKCLAELVSAGAIDRVSITGGEPLIVPDYLTLSYMFDVLDKSGIDYYAVTTNGRYLAKHVYLIKRLVKLKYLNVSRHHFDDEVNRNIFGDAEIPDLATVSSMLQMLKSSGISSRLNCTLYTDDIDSDWIITYLNTARQYGMKSVLFRPNYFGKRDPNLLDWFLDNLSGRKESTKCRCVYGDIDGVAVEYRDVDAKLERSIESSGQYIRNFVLHADGRLTGGWSSDSIVLYEFD